MFSSCPSSCSTSAKTQSRASSAKLNVNSKVVIPSVRRLSAGSSRLTATPQLVARKANWLSDSDESLEIKPALTPSLFPHKPSTIYFTVEGEKGKLSNL